VLYVKILIAFLLINISDISCCHNSSNEKNTLTVSSGFSKEKCDHEYGIEQNNSSVYEIGEEHSRIICCGYSDWTNVLKFILAILSLIWTSSYTYKKNIQLTAVRKKLLEANIELEKQSKYLIESKEKEMVSDISLALADNLMNVVDPIIKTSSWICIKCDEIERLFEKNKLSRNDIDRFNEHAFNSGKSIINNTDEIVKWIKIFQSLSKDRIENERRNIYLKEYLEASLMFLSFKLKNHKISFGVQCPDKLQIKTYPGFVSRVIINLVDFSFNYSFKDHPQNKKIIDIQVRRVGSYVNILCINNGKIISPEILPELFNHRYIFKDPYTEFDFSYIKRIVEQGLNGAITCNSSIDDGTSFSITLPDQA
jgi:hypothetical protein